MTDFDKLKTFKGKIATKWMTPNNFRRWICGANKIIKLHYRLLDSGLLWPELVGQLQTLTEAWATIGLAKYKERADSRYFAEFQDIKDFDVMRHLAFQKNIKALLGDDKVETHVEEARIREEGKKCHFCNVKLVFPAYIVHRVLAEEVYRSDSIGITCLHNTVGKLQKLMAKEDLQALLASIEVSCAA